MTISLPDAIAAFSPQLPMAVAFSGGADSTALLVACARRWPGQVVALHVNHGLQAAAVAFESHAQALCRQLGVPLRLARVNARAAPGQSPEDAARIARYQAFEALSSANQSQSAIKMVAIAQHADDQVETLLLALGRGAGLPGLSAMRAIWQQGDLVYVRPLLKVAGADVRAWLHSENVAFIEDPSNRDERFTRNRVRARLLPALAQAFPPFRDTLARSARHAAQAQGLLDELAAMDMDSLLPGPGCGPSVAGLQKLSPARQGNALRYWLKVTHATVPSSAQLRELLGQVAACTTRGHRIHIKVGGGFIERRGDRLAWYNP
jgi:tRNA(Ile)-lysidine synthase